MCNVFLVRHGESLSNAGEPTYDPENVQLTAEGHKQARSIANFFATYFSLDLIVTSSFQRTRQTASYTQEIFPALPLEEWDIGEFTYLSSIHRELSTIEDRRPLVESYWQQLKPSYKNAPGSESFASFIERVRRFIARLREETHENIAVFGHEQFITAVLWLLEREPGEISRQAMGEYRDFFRQNHIRNGAILQIQIDTLRYKLITQHLEGRERGSMGMRGGMTGQSLTIAAD